MKKLFIFFLFTFCFYIHINFCQNLSSGLKNNNTNQEQEPIIITSSEERESNFSDEIVKISQAGLNCFFKHKFNHAEYDDYISNNFSDLIEFLKHIPEESCAYNILVFKIFHQKIKSIEYVSIKELNRFLIMLPDLVGYHFTNDQKPCDHKSIIYNLLKEKFEINKKNESSFLENLAQKISELNEFISNQNVFKSEVYNLLESAFDNKRKKEENDITELTENISSMTDKAELKNIIIRFFETSISKFLWSSIDEKEGNIWQLFSDLCQNLCNLNEKNIIPDSEINDLIHSAISRFYLIIKGFAGENSSKSIYEQAWKEINGNSLLWLNIEEYHDIITPKREILLKAIKIWKTKVDANKDYGIISEPIAIAEPVMTKKQQIPIIEQ